MMQNAGTGWEIPWTGETVWQVLVVGFFFVGQVLLPLLLGSLGLGFANLSSRGAPGNLFPGVLPVNGLGRYRSAVVVYSKI